MSEELAPRRLYRERAGRRRRAPRGERDSRWLADPGQRRRGLEPSRLPHEAAFTPVAVVEQVGYGGEHAGVVRPGHEQFVAVVLGLLDEFAEPALGVGLELRTNGVGGVDVEAVQREPTSGTVHVECEVEKRADESVTRDEEIPVCRHGLELDHVGVVRPGSQLRGGRIDRVREAAECDLLQTHSEPLLCQRGWRQPSRNPPARGRGIVSLLRELLSTRRLCATTGSPRRRR